MLPTLPNLLTSLPSLGDAEVTESLITAHGIRLQRIISFGQVSPEGFWYDQKEAEWVMLLTGRARLVIAGEAEERILGPGDAGYLPAHCRHRVELGWPRRAGGLVGTGHRRPGWSYCLGSDERGGR